MHTWSLVLFVGLVGVGQVRSTNNGDCDGIYFINEGIYFKFVFPEYYKVMGVNCEANEEVSCLRIKCPAGRYCPAERYCYNPKCVCRKGYRRSHGVCEQKHANRYMDKEAVNSALLQTRFTQ